MQAQSRLIGCFVSFVKWWQWNMAMWRVVDARTLWLIALAQLSLLAVAAVAAGHTVEQPALRPSAPPPPPTTPAPLSCPCLDSLDAHGVEFTAAGLLPATVLGRLYNYPATYGTG